MYVGIRQNWADVVDFPTAFGTLVVTDLIEPPNNH